MTEIYASTNDINTGKPYFKPVKKIKKTKKKLKKIFKKLKKTLEKGHKKPEKTIYVDSNNNEISIFSKLYSQGMKNMDVKKIEAEKLFQEINYENKENINNLTEEIYNRIKNETFKKIFNLLDNDYDDIITGINIFKGIKNLPNELQKIIQPLALQLQEENETLIEAEFIRAMEDLYSLSSYNDKRILIEFHKNFKNMNIKEIKKLNNINNNYIQKKSEEKYYDSNLRIKIKDDSAILNTRYRKKNKNNNNAIDNNIIENINTYRIDNKNKYNSFSFKVSKIYNNNIIFDYNYNLATNK